MSMTAFAPGVGWAVASAGLSLAERSLGQARAQKHYDGHMPDQIKWRPGDPNDNVKPNFSRLVVDTLAAHLMGQDVPSVVTLPQPEPVQDWLDAAWEANQRMVFLMRAAITGGITGHIFARILPTAPFPRLILWDALCVTTVADPEDCESIWQYTYEPPPSTTAEGKEVRRRTLIRNASAEAGALVPGPPHWRIVDQQQDQGVWLTVASENWPWEFAPIVDAQNISKPHDTLGESTLSCDVLDLIEAISRTLSHLAKTQRYWAHPLVFSTGLGTRLPIDRSVDSLVHLPSPEAKLQVLSTQADIAGSLAYVDRLIDLLSWTTRLPAAALGRREAIPPSGVALKILYEPLVQRIETMRRLYGRFVTELDRRMLIMAGVVPEAVQSAVTDLHWPQVVPSDDLAERQVAVIDQSLHIASREEIASRFGIDYQTQVDQMAKDPQGPSVPPPAPLAAPVPQEITRAPEVK